MSKQTNTQQGLDGDRSMFAKDWLVEAQNHDENNKAFSAYFAGYIALEISATSYQARQHTRLSKPSSDHFGTDAIYDAMREKAKAIEEFLQTANGHRHKIALLQREVPDHSPRSLMDARGETDLEEATSNLARLWDPNMQKPLSDHDVACQSDNLGMIFRKVRNRLFHAEKTNDPHGSDADLLSKLNPILFGVIEQLLNRNSR